MEVWNLLIISSAFAFGGILKGATGAGAPILAVPVLAIYYDVPFAVALIVMPNIVPNIWQAFKFRGDSLSKPFVLKFAAGGAIGAALGTFFLWLSSSEYLSLGMGFIIIFYIAFKLYNPNWRLSQERANKIVIPISTLAGFFQGSAGLSSPISLTFLNSMNLKRSQFIATVSVFFAAMGLIQLPLQIYLGIMNLERFIYSSLSLIPLIIFMPLGSFIAKFLSRRRFDMIILFLLLGLAVKLILENIFL